MISFLMNWLRPLIAGAFFVSLALALTPEGKHQAAVRFAAGVLMTLLLLRPLAGADVRRFAEALQAERLRASEIEAAAAAREEEIYSSFIQRAAEEYIWSAAGALGIETLGVRLTLRGDAAQPYPWAVSLRGSYSEEQRAGLAGLLEAELGIPPERQDWSESDAD